MAAFNKNNNGLLDSGTSRSMVPDTHAIRSLAIHGSFKRLSESVSVSTANKKADSLIATFTASFCIADTSVRPRKHIILRECLLVPGLSRILISVNDLTNMGYSVLFQDTSAIISNDGTVLLTLSRKDTSTELYEISMNLLIQPSTKVEAHSVRHTSWKQFNDFHKKMAHIGDHLLVPIYRALTGLKGHPSRCKCPHCGVAKATRKPLPSHGRHKATRPLEDIHGDVVGPFRVHSIFGHRYFITIVESYFDFYFVIPIRSKSKLPECFRDTIEMLENIHQPLRVTWVYADNALNTNEFRAYARSKGIGVRLTAPYKSIQNGSAERANRTIYEGGQAMRHHAGLPPSMLIPACLYFAYIRNHIPRQKEHLSQIAPDRALSPYERMYRYDGGSWEDHLSLILPFGCECFTLRPAPAREQGKTSYRGERGIVLGRAPDRKCWLVLSLDRKCYINVYDLVSNDNVFPFRKATELPPRFPTRVISEPLLESDMDSGGEHINSDKSESIDDDDLNTDKDEFIEVRNSDELNENIDKNINDNKLIKQVSVERSSLNNNLNDFGFGLMPSPINQNDIEDSTINSRLDFSAIEMHDETEYEDTPASTSNESETTDEEQPIAIAKAKRNTRPSAKMLDVLDTIQEQEEKEALSQWIPKFKPGDTINTLEDGPCVITKPYQEGKGKLYEVTFPDWTNPDEPFSVAESQLSAMHTMTLPHFSRLKQTYDHEMDNCPNYDIEILHAHKALAQSTNTVSIDAANECVTVNHTILDNIYTDDPMYWNCIEHSTGILLPAGDFTVGDIPIPSNEMDIIPRLACAHATDTSQRPRIGITMADQVSVPKFEFEVEHHPLRDDLYQAMDREIQKQVNNETWDSQPIPLPEGDKAISTMWVFNCKTYDNGTFKRLNARLTLRGDQQKIGLNPGESYSPVMALTALRIMLSLHCADPSVEFRQMDVAGAYLTAMMTRTVYIRLPKRCVPPNHRHLVHLLKRAMYGGADSGRVFYDDILDFHKEIGFQTVMIENCYLFLEKPNGNFIKCLFHVDDFVYAFRGKELWDWYVKTLTSKYTVKINSLTRFLGINLHRDPNDGSFRLDVDPQIGKLARAFSLDKVKRFPSHPVLIGQRPTDNDIPRTEDELIEARKIPYQSAIGHLNYLQVIAYPEISYALKIASRFTTSHGKAMWKWVKNIMLYVIGRQHNTTIIRGNPVGIPRLSAFTDADHASCIDTRRSLTGYFVLLNDDVVSYACHRQRIVAHSSSESEIMALDSCLREVQYIRQLLHFMGGPNQECVTVYVDNTSVIMASKNPLQPGRNRHMPVRLFYFRPLSQERVIELHHISSSLNMADLLVTFKTPINFLNFTKKAKGHSPINH